MRIDPPTSTTSSLSESFFLASASALRTGSIVRSSSGRTTCSKRARDSDF